MNQLQGIRARWDLIRIFLRWSGAQLPSILVVRFFRNKAGAKQSSQTSHSIFPFRKCTQHRFPLFCTAMLWRFLCSSLSFQGALHVRLGRVAGLAEKGKHWWQNCLAWNPKHHKWTYLVQPQCKYREHWNSNYLWAYGFCRWCLHKYKGHILFCEGRRWCYLHGKRRGVAYQRMKNRNSNVQVAYLWS